MLNVLLFFFLVSNGLAGVTTNAPSTQPTVIIAIGAGGEEEFGKEFTNSAALWEQASRKGGVRPILVGLGPTNSTSDLAHLKQTLAHEPTNSPVELWLVFIGHGTYDGKEAKFNLRGPDLSATELGEWLKPFRRPVVVVNCASSSSPFINKLSGPDRTIVTATRSGSEENYARFGKFMAEAIADPTADLDKDEQTSLLEAFLMASRRVSEFYETEGRLATEHALLDDNGDALGTPADFFRGVRAVKKPAGGGAVDGLRAHQIHLVRNEQEQKMSPDTRARRDDVERAVAKLRELKPTLTEGEYLERLEKLLTELAQLYSRQGSP